MVRHSRAVRVIGVVLLLSPLGRCRAEEAKPRSALQGHTDMVQCVAFSPDGKILASGSRDRTIKLWDVASGKNTATLTGHKRGGWWLAFSRDGKVLASAGHRDQTVKLWDVQTGKNTATLTGHTDWVWSVAFSPDGKTVASGSSDKS